MSSGLEDGIIVEREPFICNCGFTIKSVYRGLEHIQKCNQYKQNHPDLFIQKL